MDEIRAAVRRHLLTRGAPLTAQILPRMSDRSVMLYFIEHAVEMGRWGG